jgi:capsid protein
MAKRKKVDEDPITAMAFQIAETRDEKKRAALEAQQLVLVAEAARKEREAVRLEILKVEDALLNIAQRMYNVDDVEKQSLVSQQEVLQRKLSHLMETDPKSNVASVQETLKSGLENMAKIVKAALGGTRCATEISDADLQEVLRALKIFVRPAAGDHPSLDSVMGKKAAFWYLSVSVDVGELGLILLSCSTLCRVKSEVEMVKEYLEVVKHELKSIRNILVFDVKDKVNLYLIPCPMIN